MLQTRGPLGVPVLFYLYMGPIDISAHWQELKTETGSEDFWSQQYYLSLSTFPEAAMQPSVFRRFITERHPHTLCRVFVELA